MAKPIDKERASLLSFCRSHFHINTSDWQCRERREIGGKYFVCEYFVPFARTADKSIELMTSRTSVGWYLLSFARVNEQRRENRDSRRLFAVSRSCSSRFRRYRKWKSILETSVATISFDWNEGIAIMMSRNYHRGDFKNVNTLELN